MSLKGGFQIEGKEELQFWIRAFQFDNAIKHAQSRIMAEQRIVGATVPILTEYQCGRFYWQVFIAPYVDALGIQEGRGLVWFTDDLKVREEQTEECAQVADKVLSKLRIDEEWVMETPKER